MESILNLAISPCNTFILGANLEGIVHVWLFEDIFVCFLLITLFL